MTSPSHRVSANVASLYKDACSESEQVSQLIWGSGVDIIEAGAEFSKICGEDRYVGWMRNSHLFPAPDDSDQGVSNVASLFAEVYAEPDGKSQILTRLTVGSRLILSRRSEERSFTAVDLPDGAIGYMHRAQISATYERASFMLRENAGSALYCPEEVINALRRQVASDSVMFAGIPYLWGGATPFGMDCSGFTQLVYKINGIQLLRDSSRQWSDKRFQKVECPDGLGSATLQPSDLVFFGNDQTNSYRITHVGLALSDDRFVHSAGKGRGNIISRRSEHEFASKFVGARRLRDHVQLSIEFA